jgi:hypothetical protein
MMNNMDRTARMTDVMGAGRMARMRVKVTAPVRETVYVRTALIVIEAMRLAGEAEFNTKPRSSYRNDLIN